MLFPEIQKDSWFHVGDLSKKVKRNSYEGSGLSISTVPNSWRKIARLSGEVFELNKPDGRFLDVLALSLSSRRTIFEWAIVNQYLSTKKLWVYDYYDDEYRSFYQMEFESLENLLQTVELDELDELEEEERTHLFSAPSKVKREEKQSSIFGVERYQATEKLLLAEEWEGGCTSSISEDFAIARYTDEVLHLDGLYWDELHDVARMSAPRAVIFQSRLQEWNITTQKRQV